MGNQFGWQRDPQTRATSKEDLGGGMDDTGVLVQPAVQSKNHFNLAVNVQAFRSVQP